MEGRQREFGEFNTSGKNPNARVRLKVWFGIRQSEGFGGEPGSGEASKGERRGGEGPGLGTVLLAGRERGVRSDQVRIRAGPEANPELRERFMENVSVM